MRQFKFRFWDTVSQKMLYDELAPLYYHVPRSLYGEEIEGEAHLYSLSQLLDRTDFIAQQFVGLKDMNGEDIYEGDIVTHLHSADTCVVVFQKSTAMFLAQEIGDEQMGFGIEDVTEVIGNIYENANLLQGVA